MGYRRRKRRNSGGGKKFVLILLLALVLGGVVGSYLLFFEGHVPIAQFQNTGDYIGSSSTVGYRVEDQGSGLHSINLTIVQGSTVKTVFSQTFPRSTYRGQVGPLVSEETIQLDPVKTGLKDGPATLKLEAADFSLRGWFTGNKTTIVKELTIDTVSPKIQLLHGEQYLSPGGTGIAIYKITEKDTRHGVEINGLFNQGYELDSSKGDVYIAYFALPFDAQGIENQSIVASDAAGNKTIYPFSTQFKPTRFRHDVISVTDGFLKNKIPEFRQYYPELEGHTYLENYIYANSVLRKKNNLKIYELCQDSESTRLWQDHFTRMPGSTRAGYADHRTYKYKGQDIDHQVHLGVDLASTKRVEVKAANSGKVIFADYLGIYGNMIIVDHGQGVFSLYSHLSQTHVQPGDSVSKSSVIGLTGKTGMAGGDHLHFSMLIHGIFVTPKEWWDQHWIDVTIQGPMLDAKF